MCGIEDRGCGVKVLSYFLAALAGAVAAASVLILVPGIGMRADLSSGQTKAVESVLEKYLQSHPELVSKALQQLQERQQAAEAEQQRTALKAHAAALFDDPTDPVLGNPKGDVTVVEFFDYRCPYCKRALPDVMATLKADGNIRLVLKEFPILGPDSQLATRAALAAVKQGKYAAFHLAMLGATTALNEQTIMAIAESSGLDIKRLREDMNSPDVDALIRKNYQLADSLKIEGTPAFIVGDQLVPGAVDKAALEKLVRAARKKG
jgi:protein-disulfide isomerase